MRNKYLYRVTAYYDTGIHVVRHYQNLRAAKLWKQQREKGYEEQYDGFLEDGREAIPPATRVTLERSEPIVFPALEKSNIAYDYDQNGNKVGWFDLLYGVNAQ